jgi:hypothetical protein
MSLTTWEDTCSLCQQSRWWLSRVHDYKVCWWCSNGDPLAALVILARRGSPGAIKRAQSWAEEGEQWDAHSARSK